MDQGLKTSKPTLVNGGAASILSAVGQPSVVLGEVLSVSYRRCKDSALLKLCGFHLRASTWLDGWHRALFVGLGGELGCGSGVLLASKRDAP